MNISLAPYIRSKERVNTIMLKVIISLLPPLVAATLIFGIKALLLIGIGIGACVATELITQKLLKLPLKVDGSSVITGIILAMSMPVHEKYRYVVIGSIIAIILGKMISGGTGKNKFNPVLIGRTVIVLFFSEAFHYTLDGVSGATLLKTMSQSGEVGGALMGGGHLYKNIFLGSMGGALGETSVLAILLGGAYLIYTKVIDWRIPLTIVISMGVMSGIFLLDPVVQIFSGSALFAAVYMATDPVTSPVTREGRIIYSAGIGILIMLIRRLSPLPEGALFAILIMNFLSDKIDEYIFEKNYS